MKTLILALSLLVAGSAVAAEPVRDANGCYQKLVTVCPIKKPKPKVVPVPIPPPVVVIPKCPEPQPLYVLKTVFRPVPAPYPVFVNPACNESQDGIVGLHVAMGVGVRDPYVSGQIGVRFKFKPAYVGFEVFSALQYGVGLQTLAYVYQGPRVSVHVVDLGVLVPFSDNHLLGVPDIKRKADLLLGAGVEVKLVCHLNLTADWRVGIPDPSYLNAHKDCGGTCDKHINVRNAIGDAFASSQLFLGLMLRN